MVARRKIKGPAQSPGHRDPTLQPADQIGTVIALTPLMSTGWQRAARSLGHDEPAWCSPRVRGRG
jgi:hypothetical protein